MESRSPISLILITIIVILAITKQCSAIMCYECNSNVTPDCGENFDSSRLLPMDCDRRSLSQGRITMCKKSKQKDTGLIIRRCASGSELMNQATCTWGNDEMGRYGEQCFCSTDRCNGASALQFVGILTILPVALMALYRLF